MTPESPFISVFYLRGCSAITKWGLFADEETRQHSAC